MWVHQSTLHRFCSSLGLWGTQRVQHFLTPRLPWRMRVRLPDEIFMISCISAHAIFGVLLNQELYPRDVFWGNGCCHSTTMVIVFQSCCSRHKLSESPENSRFGRRMISKTVFYTLKAILKRFSIAVVIIHHNSEIPSWKVNTVDRGPVTLTKHFLAWNENGCMESSEMFCHKYYETGLWCNVKNKVVTSLVHLGCKT